MVEALLGQQSAFARTPKTGAEGKQVKVAVKKSYRGSKTLTPLVEIAFGVYFTLALWFAVEKEIWTSIPFLLLFQTGFLYVGLTSLLEGKVRVAEVLRLRTQPVINDEIRRAA